MLVLSRKVGERIVLPHVGIVLTVLEVRGGQIRLGVSAPPEVAVFREELWLSRRAAEDELLGRPPGQERK